MRNAPPPLVVVDSVTDLTGAHRGGIAVTGSHGGRYPGSLALDAGMRGTVFCDAGIGLDGAGVAGLEILDDAGIPALAAAADSCRIGEGRDVLESGRVSTANQVALDAGVRVGQPVRDAVELLTDTAPVPVTRAPAPAVQETRVLRVSAPLAVWVLDSASLVTPDDSGSIVITGSHGGAPGGEAARALKCTARLAAFNDAGIGKNDSGLGRLPLLEGRGIPAVTVSAATARIGEGASTLDDGVISAMNAGAAALGATLGTPLAQLVNRLLSAHS